MPRTFIDRLRTLISSLLRLPEPCKRALDVDDNGCSIAPPAPRNVNERRVRRGFGPPRVDDTTFGVGG
jgi:hypothetical protein